MQKTITVRGRIFSPKQVLALAKEDETVELNGNDFYVTYRVDEHCMFENTKRNDPDATCFLLWGRGYKYAIVLPYKEATDKIPF